MKNKNMMYHMMALLTISIWGTTFVFTKILLEVFSPVEIMLYRFVITYVTLMVIHPRFHKISLKDEGLFVLLGIFGGSLYFLTENIALHLTPASNVGFLLATAPIFTALLAHLFTKDEKMSKNIWIGFVIAMLGVFLVMFNGNFILKLSPLGDMLSIAAALSWALYTILLKKLDTQYTPIYTTRKVYFYAILTIIPVFLASGYTVEIHKFMDIAVTANLLFLGLAASALGFILWNIAVKHLGAVKTNNYIYLNPVITLIGAVWVLHERLTLYSALGSVLILAGVYLSQHKKTKTIAINETIKV
jgi:drug/metabolite transporter (DMT)-like permease